MRGAARPILGALLVAGLALAATPAFAGGPKADLKVAKHKSGPYKTNDLYEAPGPFSSHEQRATRTVKPGVKKSFFVKLENDLNDGNVHLLAYAGCADEGPFSGLCARWFDLTNDEEITDDLSDQGTHEVGLGPIQPQVRFRVQVKVKQPHAPSPFDIGMLADGSNGDDAAVLRVKVG
jgi:hypothetical protein